jgi:hypothetical protein
MLFKVLQDSFLCLTQRQGKQSLSTEWIFLSKDGGRQLLSNGAFAHPQDTFSPYRAANGIYSINAVSPLTLDGRTANN